MESPPLRLGLIAAGLATLVLTFAFIEQVPWAIDLWPFETSRLSHLFIASILIAIAVPMLWIGVSGELAAIRFGAVNLAVIYSGMLIYLLTLVGESGRPALGGWVAVFGLALLVTIAMFGWSRRLAWLDPRPMPGPVLASFALFALILVAAGVALVLGAEIFPWPLDEETSVMFGCIYLGAAVYFVGGLIEPRWPNAAGQLAGFLAYDLVLIGPFVDRFGEVSGGELTSLFVYTGFVVYSGALAAYYLFAAPATRLRLGRPGERPG